ncbi:pacearchaeosortase [Candidatus Pacearchaeota archaeon]|nr:pacearchaeosortase [Candidatus Pacearchaeota archaeon]
MNYKGLISLLARYLIIIIIALFNLSIIYLIFTPITTFIVKLLLKIFYSDMHFFSNTTTFYISGNYINLIPACIAGAAYYLLLLLNLTTPMDIKSRTKSILFLVFSFLILNVIRITIFSFLFVSGFQYFDIAHRWVWYLGSTFLVVALWFTNIFIFKVKSIPFYSDIINILKDVKKGKR